MSSTVVGPGHVIAGRYRIEGWLGQGGMGSVYRAVQLSVQRTVALKLLVEEHLTSPAHVQRFEREALALSRLSHQSTVRLFDFGADERGRPFIVMEHLNGVDLATDLERHGPMRWDQALEVSLGVLGSLEEAHAAGIVHRDIKPANLFLCAGPAWPSVKVLDFGIAGGADPRVDARKLTLTGTVVGSAPYMSPEQARGLSVTAAADLYSFGVVLFEMLTDRTPFDTRPLTGQLLAKVLEPAPALRDVSPELDVPAEVQALVAALLERDPARRPLSARASADGIRALLGRASLPPLSRAEQRPRRASAPSAIPRTEPMLVPRTIDEGWTPPRLPEEARPGGARGGLGWVLALGASAAGAVAWTAWVAAAARFEPEVSAPVAALSPSALPSDGASDRARPVAEDAGDMPADAASSDAELARELELGGISEATTGALPVQEPPVEAEPPGAIKAALPAPARPAATPRAKKPSARPRVEPRAAVQPAEAVQPAQPEPAPSAPAPAETSPSRPPTRPVTPDQLLPGALIPPTTAAPERHEPAPRAPPSSPSARGWPWARAPQAETPHAETAPPEPPAPSGPPQRRPRITDPSYWTIASARAAARRGEITPAERNEIIGALQRRRLSARARAARAYRQGRIDFDELLDRQRAIDRRVEGW